jgi:hypothetical protein
MHRVQLSIATAWTVNAADSTATLVLSDGTNIISTRNAVLSYTGSSALSSVLIQTGTRSGERISFASPATNGFVLSGGGAAALNAVVAVCVSGLSAPLASNVTVVVPSGCAATDNYNGCLNNLCSPTGSVRCVSLQSSLQCDCRPGIHHL